LPKKLPPAPTLRNAATTDGGSVRGGYSLADFLIPPAPLPSKQKTSDAPWAGLRKPDPNYGKSLREIQEEEAEFVSKKQDSLYGRGGGIWFIERRERANSLAAIQDAAEKCRKEQLFLEEQLQIEMQIKKELSLERRRAQSLVQKPRRRNRKTADEAQKNRQTSIRGQEATTDKDCAHDKMRSTFENGLSGHKSQFHSAAPPHKGGRGGSMKKNPQVHS